VTGLGSLLASIPCGSAEPVSGWLAQLKPDPLGGGANLDGGDILQTVAEIAIALTGFTGIVAALGWRRDSPWSRFDLARFRTLLISSLAASLFSLLPFLFFHSGVSSDAVWSVGSGLIALYMAVVTFFDARSLRAVTDMSSVDRALVPTFAVLGLAVWGAQIANIIFVHEFAPYLGALLWFILLASLTFVRLLLSVVADQTS